jgi:hypothetical protein
VLVHFATTILVPLQLHFGCEPSKYSAPFAFKRPLPPPPLRLNPASSFLQTHRVGGDNVVHECRKRHTPASPFLFKISAPSSCRKEPKRPAKSISLNDLYDLHGEILLILIFQTLPKIGIRILFLLISVMYRLTCIN